MAVKGDLASFMNALEALGGDGILYLAHKAVYDGEKAGADVLRQVLSSYPVKQKQSQGMTQADKDDLLLGLSAYKHKEEKSKVAGAVWFGGYSEKHYWYKDGKRSLRPIPAVANICLSGSRYHAKDDFIVKAKSKIEKQASEAMESAAEKALQDAVNKLKN